MNDVEAFNVVGLAMVVCRIETQTVSDSTAAAARTSVGNALTNPAWPTSFKKSRRVQNRSGCNIALALRSQILPICQRLAQRK